MELRLAGRQRVGFHITRAFDGRQNDEFYEGSPKGTDFIIGIYATDSSVDISDAVTFITKRFGMALTAVTSNAEPDWWPVSKSESGIAETQRTVGEDDDELEDGDGISSGWSLPLSWFFVIGVVGLVWFLWRLIR